MTVRRGAPWGEPSRLPDDAVVVGTDREVARLVEASDGDAPPVFALTGGDLHRTLGGPLGTPRWERGEAQRFPIDVLDVRLDGAHHVAVAHLVAQGRLGWLGETVVALNAAFVGTDYLGPRAHPNDGLVDVTEGRLPVSDLLAARRRFESGSHLPHPSLRESRVASYEIELPRPVRVALDGEPVGAFRRLSVEVRPDAISVVL